MTTLPLQNQVRLPYPCCDGIVATATVNWFPVYVVDVSQLLDWCVAAAVHGGVDSVVVPSSSSSSSPRRRNNNSSKYRIAWCWAIGQLELEHNQRRSMMLHNDSSTTTGTALYLTYPLYHWIIPIFDSILYSTVAHDSQWHWRQPQWWRWSSCWSSSCCCYKYCRR